MTSPSESKPPRLSRKYTIAKPETYDVVALSGRESTPQPPTSPPSDPLAERIERFAAVAQEPRISGESQVRDRRAVWIVHGMGQQIPFETLDSLTNGLLRVANEVPDFNVDPEAVPRMRTVKLGDQTVQRVELDATDNQGHEYELHLYESYWAPKTEGVAQLTDVIGFLKDGAVHGLINCFKTFRRAMFGTMEPFHVHRRTALWLLIAIAVLAALTAINSVILLAGAAKAHAPLPEWMKNAWPMLTAWASWISAVMIAFGGMLELASMVGPRQFGERNYFARKSALDLLRAGWKKVPSFVTWLAFSITLCALMLTAAVMSIPILWPWLPKVAASDLQESANLGIVVVLVALGLGMLVRTVHRSEQSDFYDSWPLFGLFMFSGIVFWGIVPLPFGFGERVTAEAARLGIPAWAGSSRWVWPALIFLSAQVRELLVEYVGDVAIYVTSTKLDRFEKVRADIKDGCRQLASAIYGTKDPAAPKQPYYSGVGIIGHSLGSVIAYDTLNRLLLDDALSQQAVGVLARTKALITFGSPLDKTAFLFSIQGTDALHVREQLAATVQPLIQSASYRTFPWFNIYSGNDIISGNLIFYDPPRSKDEKAQDWAVENVPDYDARTPLVAHTQYWANTTVWRCLMMPMAGDPKRQRPRTASAGSQRAAVAPGGTGGRGRT